MKKLAFLVSTGLSFYFTFPAIALSPYVMKSDSFVPAVNPAGTFVPDSNDNDVVVTIPVPFPFWIYDMLIPTGQYVTVSSNGNIQFAISGGEITGSNTTLPASTLPDVPAIMPYWDDLSLSGLGEGIFTSVTGAEGNRVFDIEWRGRRKGDGDVAPNVNFEVRFFENSDRFEIAYALTGMNSGEKGASATIGVQSGNQPLSQSTQFAFNGARLIEPGSGLVAVSVPFGFSPIAVFGFISANIIRRKGGCVEA